MNATSILKLHQNHLSCFKTLPPLDFLTQQILKLQERIKIAVHLGLENEIVSCSGLYFDHTYRRTLAGDNTRNFLLNTEPVSTAETLAKKINSKCPPFAFHSKIFFLKINNIMEKLSFLLQSIRLQGQSREYIEAFLFKDLPVDLPEAAFHKNVVYLTFSMA